MLVDLHVPTNSLEPAGDVQPLLEVLSDVRLQRLDGLCLSIRRVPRQDDWERLSAAAHPARLFLAIEVETHLGPLLWVPSHVDDAEALEPLGHGRRVLDAERTLVEAARLKAAVVAAQPLRLSRTRKQVLNLLRQLGIHALEVCNAGRPEQENNSARKAARRLELVGVGGSGDLAGLGAAATLFEEPVRSQGGLASALRRGAVWPVALRS